MSDKKYNEEQEMEKVCKENKITWKDPQEHDSIKATGFLPLALNEINTFLGQNKPNGSHLLYITDPADKGAKYGFRINYDGNEEVGIEEQGQDNEDYFNVNQGGKITIDVHLFAEDLLKNHTFKTIFGSKKDLVYVYEDDIYKLKGEEIIKTYSENKLKEHCKTYLVREITEKIKRQTAVDFEEFEKIPIHLIPLENGVYNIKTNKLESYDSKIYFKFKLPITYDKNARYIVFGKFIEETLYPQDVDLIQEWFGFCLYRKYLFKKGMIWFGDTDTGKTTLLTILERLIGINNCSGLSLQKISGENNFDLSSLHNKSLNSFDDLSAKDINDGGGFKIATGGGSITGEYKFGDKFKFHNHSKLLFACNKIPSPKDIDDNAYFSRWFPIAFDNQIEGDKQNPHLAEECLKEKSGILNWALIGLNRLLKKEKFSFDKKPQEVKAIMCRAGHPLFAFVKDKCNEQEGVWISKQDLFEEYQKYMLEQKLPIMSKEMFGRNIKRYCNYIYSSESGKLRGWRNIRVGGYNYEKL